MSSASRRQILTALASLALGAAALGCRKADPDKKRGDRIVSISPSTTESVFAIGAGALLVGRSSQCDYPAEAEGLPIVGGFADPSLEAILALRPTLVVGDRGPAGPAFVEALTAQSIQTFFPAVDSIAQIEEMLRELGRRLDHTAGADRVTAEMAGAIDRVEARVRGLRRPKVVWVFDFVAVVVAGPGGFPDELLRVSGGDNVVREGGAYPRLSVERLLALDPDVIIDGTGDDPASAAERKRSLARRPGFEELRAIRQGRLVALRSSTALRPGPRIGQGVAEVASLLHPGEASL